MRAESDVLRVPWGQRWIGALFARWPGLGTALGNLETRVVADEIAAVQVERPVFICGLARAGSTILLEALNAHPAFTAHRYSDYPPVWTPYWWNALRARLPLPRVDARERAHADGIEVTPDNPEAFEEVLWMHFFPDSHIGHSSAVLDRSTRHPAFERFYIAHIRKLLAVRRAARYLSKGNYNSARIGYLRHLFADARFVIPVREPIAHVASLIKQDRLFVDAARRQPAVATQLARIGHFEFGPYKRAQHLGNAARVRAIADAHVAGDAVGAYAWQWVDVYDSLLDRLGADHDLASACCWIHYEALCAQPRATLQRMFRHVEADDVAAAAVVDAFADRIRAPDYYDPGLDDAERRRILEITGATAARLMRSIAP